MNQAGNTLMTIEADANIGSPTFNFKTCKVCGLSRKMEIPQIMQSHNLGDASHL